MFQEICLIGRPIYMDYTLPSILYNREEFLTTATGYVAEIVFDILGSNNINEERIKVGEIHGYLLNVDRMERDSHQAKHEFCSNDDISRIYWKMVNGVFGNNEKNKNIFYIDYIKIKKEYRHDLVATTSVLMVSRVIYEQFNTVVGYLVVKASPVLDKTKFQKKDLDIYQRLCDKFWNRLGFISMESYKYYNMTNDLIKENVARFSEWKYAFIIEPLCHLKIMLEARQVHILEYDNEQYYFEGNNFSNIQAKILKEFLLEGSVYEWKWIFYSRLGLIREFISSKFVSTNVKDDSIYVKMLDHYGLFLHK